MTDHHDNAQQLRRHVQKFVRLFGLMQDHQTPCGQPLSVPHAHTLMILLDAEASGQGGLRISELGEGLNLDKSNVSRLCARMEQEGHLERRPCPEDGRAKRLWLTDDGRQLARQVDRASLQRFTQMLEAMPAGGREQVIRTLDTLNQAIADVTSR